MTDFRVPICCSCFRALTSDERNYYQCRCGLCERRLEERIERWRAGHPDPELDQMAAKSGQVR